MNEARRRLVLSGFKLFDIGVVIIAFGLATILVVHSNQTVNLREFLSMRVKLSNCIIFASILLTWHMIFSLCGLYESRRLSARPEEIVQIVKATTVAALSLGLIGVLFPITMVTHGLLILFWGISSALMVACRTVLRVLLGSVRRHGHNLRYMLLVGTNQRAIEFAQKIVTKPELGYRLLGFVDDEWQGLDEFRQTGFPLVCSYAGILDFLRHNVVDELAMYLPLRSSYQRSFEVAALCEQHGITMRFDGDIFGLKTARSSPEEFEGDHHISAHTGAGDWHSLMIKRLLDIVLSLVLLVLLAPLLVVVALLIKLSSEGPIVFRQERLGLNKRKFSIFKFRTMVRNAEQMIADLEHQNEVSGPVFKIKNDPRITPIGKILRRTSIDELTQLFNVLKGDMSLVGPRPLPVRDYKGFSEDWQRRRFSVRPGITCLWQVNGRSSLPFEQWMKLDLQYMDEWSLWLDLKILARTIPAVLKGSGAA